MSHSHREFTSRRLEIAFPLELISQFSQASEIWTHILRVFEKRWQSHQSIALEPRASGNPIKQLGQFRFRDSAFSLLSPQIDLDQYRKLFNRFVFANTIQAHCQ